MVPGHEVEKVKRDNGCKVVYTMLDTPEPLKCLSCCAQLQGFDELHLGGD